ncbi:MAG TPA: type VI secretion system accessory protein TagJ [Bryobacteraceae bacterium]|jgi:type VI secretion system protein ImpE|nr:type VI secretion system accessory protein TagJ [Bryobacteraceae bacterium]
MKAKELFQAGRLDEAVRALGAELRDDPADTQRRTFLFELLCFAGDFQRAEKQLDVLGETDPTAAMAVLLYRGVLRAENARQGFFSEKQFLGRGATPETGTAGVCNGKPFTTFIDADPRIGARLEVLAGGRYLWIPFQHISSVEIEAPQRLRDLLWAPAVVRTTPAFKERDLGAVFVPVLSPGSSTYPDDAVRLGRATAWLEPENGNVIPMGQKMFLVDEEELPLLELRHLDFSHPEVSVETNASS